MEEENKRIFNLSKQEKRDELKKKDDTFKKQYFIYDNKERASRRRDKDKNVNIQVISQDPVLNENPSLFKQKLDEMFKLAKRDALISNSNFIDEIINDNPTNNLIISLPEKDINNNNKQDQNDINNLPENDDIINNKQDQNDNINTPENNIIINKQDQNDNIIKEQNDKEDIFYQDVIYANTIISKSVVIDDDKDGYILGDDINIIKNYNIKIPVELLNKVYIKMPNNNTNTNTSLIIDGEYAYIFIK